MEVLYAAATAAQVAYSAYVYTVVPVERFQLVTGYTQAALLAGRCLGGVAGQVLVATGLCDYYSLNFISLGATAAATVVAAFLPAVERSVYFHRGSKDDQVSFATMITIRLIDFTVSQVFPFLSPLSIPFSLTREKTSFALVHF